MQDEVCSIEGCARKLEAVGLCRTHRKRRAAGLDMHAPIREKRAGRVCSVVGCGRDHYAQGFCNPHYQRRAAGRPLATPIDPLPDGTTRIYDSGYVYEKRAGKWGKQHTIRMEELLGRPLVKGETVHHVNGDRADNTTDGPIVGFRSGNLELWSKAQPAGQRVADKVAFAKAILLRYEVDALTA